MINVYKISNIDRSRWLDIVQKFDDYNYRQSWDYGILSAKRIGGKCEHIVLRDFEGNIISAAEVRIKKIPVIGGGIAYINGGPMIRRNKNQVNYEILTNTLLHEYVYKRKMILRIAPPIEVGQKKFQFHELMLKKRFHLLSQRMTILIDLSKSLTEIRKNFHQKWRNCLNKSERNDIEVKIGQDEFIFKEFLPLFNEFIEKKKFHINLSGEFYYKCQKVLDIKEKYFIILASYDGKIVSGYVGSILGDTCVYILGASNDLGRKINASYLLQWEAIKLSKEKGCLWYDLGGIDSKNNKGVYTFKKRMRGEEIYYPGPYQLSISGIRTSIVKYGEMVFKSIKF